MKICILSCLIIVAFFKYSQGHGLCAFPCSIQGRVFKFPALNNDDDILDYSGYDPTSYSANVFGETYTGYCYARSGPFFALRRQINGTTTYLCIKDSMVNKEHNFVVYYRMAWVHFPGNPTICDICHGEGFWPALVLKDLSAGKYAKILSIYSHIVCNLTIFNLFILFE
ncbi:uncharacterized protein [Mytilus edulis]|uniref:uncharacterized protein isoform X1 n=1 Tax=Mytilus edulis TaxID=6550 RepID=UPI0039EF5F07